MCAHTHIQWQGAEGSPFQHQQADESLGPNSLKAELALLLFLPPLSFFFSLIFQTHHLKFKTRRATDPLTSREFLCLLFTENSENIKMTKTEKRSMELIWQRATLPERKSSNIKCFTVQADLDTQL